MNIKTGIILLLFFKSALTHADTAVCEIVIDDVNGSVAHKKIVESNRVETFSFEPGASALTATQRKHFELPGGQYVCNLAFVDLQAGASLSCESSEDKGYTYFQSEQGGNAGNSSKIFLTFRHAKSHFTISAACKKA